MITIKENGPVRFLEDGDEAFDEIASSDCNCVGREFCQIVHSGDTTPFQVALSEATGTNLTVNGGFSSDVSWTKGSGWTITGGKAVHTASGGGALTASSNLAVNGSTYYKIVFTISDYSNSQNLSVVFAGDTVKTLNANGTYTVYWFTDAVLVNPKISFTPHSTTSLKIDDVSIKEISTVVYGIKDLNGDVVKSVSNGTGVTYYQETASIEVDWSDVDDGCYRLFLIDNSNNLFVDADNGSFEDVAANWDITEGSGMYIDRIDAVIADYEASYKGYIQATAGEMILNGGFSSGANWTTSGTGWAIGAGTATHTGGVFGNLFQACALVTGRTYRVSYTVNTNPANTSQIQVGSVTNAITITGTGDFINYITLTGSIVQFLVVFSDNTLDIDNISISEYSTPLTSTIFEGDTAIAVNANSDYIITGRVYFPLPLISGTSSTNFVYLKPTTYALSQCDVVVGATCDSFSFFGITRRVTYTDGNFTSNTQLGLSGIWVEIRTSFNTGSNTSLNIGLYANGNLADYSQLLFYVDAIEMRGPVNIESECFKKGDFDCTKLLKWSNNENAYGFIYEGTAFEHQLRVKSKLWKPKYPKDKKEVFVDSVGNRRILTSRTKKEQKFNISEIPEYLHDAISIGVEHDNFYIDGVKYINEETDYDPNWRNSSMLAPVELVVTKDSQDLSNSYC